MHDNNKTVVIIGAGPAGLSAAYHAQKSGYQVVLLEKAETAKPIFLSYKISMSN